jgi:hypothetical protein
MGLRNLFKSRQPGNATQTGNPPPSKTQQSGPNTGPLTPGTNGHSPGLQSVPSGQINLVNYSPEELMQHVERTISTVHFGMSLQHRFKENAAELWSVLGPIVLFAGTAGEVFFFIWNNVAATAAWWVALSVLATVAVLECTFMVLSYKCDTLRNQFKSKPGGATDEDKQEMAAHHRFWFLLAAGVAFGQISFLVFSMMAKFNNLPFLIAFALGRSVVTLAADYYTAFIHRAKPTTGEVAKLRQKQQADLTADLLRQKSDEVTIINSGILTLRQAHTEAEIREDKLRTQLEVEKLQNRAQVETLKNQQVQATMFTELGNNLMRALFDPKLPDDERQKLLATMQGFMSAMNQLPQPRITSIEEEEA